MTTESDDYISFGDAEKADKANGTLVSFKTIMLTQYLPGGRNIGVGRELQGDRYLIRTEAPLPESGKPVVLKFGLSREAALSLASLILQHEARHACSSVAEQRWEAMLQKQQGFGIAEKEKP